MNWYKTAQINTTTYLSQEEIELLEQKQHTLSLYKNSLSEIMNIIENENREATPDEQIRIDGNNFFINKIQNDITEIEKKVKQSTNDDDRKNIYLENLAKQEPNLNEEGERIGGFGLTGDINEAGYIMRDGSMLDFSGKIDGGPAGKRELDHRQIGSIGKGDFIEGDYTEAMREFMYRTGAIRVNFHDGLNIDIASQITEQQQRTILKNSKNINYFQIDISDQNGYNIWTDIIDMPRISDVTMLMKKANKQF